MRISSIAKSITAGIAAGATAAVTAVQDNVLTTGEGVTIALAVLGAWGIVYAVPNKPKTTV
ncbi:MAG: hypothetical protein HOV73_18375 [Streptomyces sp.]|nr:hypothetical protein [Streptomyces sp.]NUR66146.1 hypothetical protein [Streptomyces sp.]NUS24867.1 hypothetical protein [Streptomyces sp.]NUS25593.1 hypothetical protein [Streptomyces sp.]NUS76575.1 hypothetical protein [Streptomyces sp.]